MPVEHEAGGAPPGKPETQPPPERLHAARGEHQPGDACVHCGCRILGRRARPLVATTGPPATPLARNLRHRPTPVGHEQSVVFDGLGALDRVADHRPAVLRFTTQAPRSARPRRSPPPSSTVRSRGAASPSVRAAPSSSRSPSTASTKPTTPGLDRPVRRWEFVRVLRLICPWAGRRAAMREGRWRCL